MARWRAEALARLPELRQIIASADCVMRLWVELVPLFERAYERQPPDESLIARIYDYSDWCVRAPRHADAAHDPLTAVAVAFYEHIPTHDAAREDMPRWFLASELQQARETFSYHIGSEALEELLRHVTANASRYRGREARIRRALESIQV